MIMKKEEISKRIEEIENELKELRTKLSDDKSINLENVVPKQIKLLDYEMDKYGVSTIIVVRGSGEYENKSFFLNQYFDWEIKKDSLGSLCLIPTKK